MGKKYTFLCNACGIRYETPNKNANICRRCVQSGAHTEDYGKPIPTALQAAKWEHTRFTKKLIEERQKKIEEHNRKEDYVL